MSTESSKLSRRLWVTYPHRFGSGKTHLLSEAGTKTRCGVSLSSAPGEEKQGILSEVTCQNCRGVLERAVGRLKWRSRWPERDIDLVDLTDTDLQRLADGFENGDVAAFLENYADFKEHFKNEDWHTIDDSGWDAGSLFCGRCGNRLSEDYALDTEHYGCGAEFSCIWREYACWKDIYTIGKHYCDYCQHVSEKDD